MRLIFLGSWLSAAAILQGAAPLSPPVTWAGCAGAITAKVMLLQDKALAPLLQRAAQRALQEAKQVPNPQGLSSSQIDGVAMSAARAYLDEVKQSPDRSVALDRAVQDCTDAVGKLP